MASQSLAQRHSQGSLPQGLEDEYTCQICQEEFNEDTKKPKTLPVCLHTLCKECVQQLHQRRSNNNEIQCPFCREHRLVPNGNVDELPTNRIVLRLLEFSDGRQARQLIKAALNKCKEKSAELRRSELRFEEEKSLTLAEIHEHSDGIIEQVNEEKDRLTEELDAAYEAKKETLPGLVQLGQIRSCIENVETFLRQEDSEAAVERKEALISEMEMLCTQTNAAEDNEDGMQISFVPKTVNLKVGDVKCLAKTENQEGVCDQIKVLWQYILTFAILPMCLKLEAVCNTRVCLAIRYYLFQSPFLTEFRTHIEHAFKPGNEYYKNEFYVHVSCVLVHMGVFSIVMVLGYYHAQLASLRVPPASPSGGTTAHWGWGYITFHYNFIYILLFEAVIAIYLHFMLIQSINKMFKQFKTMNMAFLSWECADKGLLSLIFILVTAYISNFTALIPVLSIGVMVILAYVSSGFYFSHVSINHIDSRNNKHFSYSFGIQALVLLVMGLLCVSSALETKYPSCQKISILCTLILQPLLLLELLQRCCFKTEDQDFNSRLIPKGVGMVVLFATIAAMLHVTSTWSQSIIPNTSTFEIVTIFSAIVVLGVSKSITEEFRTWAIFFSMTTLYLINKNIEFIFEVGSMTLLACGVFIEELLENNSLYFANNRRYFVEIAELSLMLSGIFFIDYIKMVFIPVLLFAIIKIDHDAVFGTRTERIPHT